MKKCRLAYVVYILLEDSCDNLWRRVIVVMDFDCYTGVRGSIPAHGSTHAL